MNAMERYEFSVLEVAQDLAGSVTGTFGGRSRDEMDRRAQWLKCRLAEWTPSIGVAESFDDAVRNLAKAALALYESEKGPQ